ncbi:MAG: 50S ribosomal protein L30 [Chloroflexi bacterium]|nr:50S ribosomal protein L30 [Chloroflexota bacterium]
MTQSTTAPIEGARVRITLVKSPIGYNQRQRDTVRSLGLRRLHQVVEQKDSAVLRGMVDSVSHLVRVVEPTADTAVKE